MAKTRVDVVVGVTPDLAVRLEAYRKVLEDRKGGVKVTRTEAIRALLTISLRDRLPAVIAQQLPPLAPISAEAEALAALPPLPVVARPFPREAVSV